MKFLKGFRWPKVHVNQNITLYLTNMYNYYMAIKKITNGIQMEASLHVGCIQVSRPSVLSLLSSPGFKTYQKVLRTLMVKSFAVNDQGSNPGLAIYCQHQQMTTSCLSFLTGKTRSESTYLNKIFVRTYCMAPGIQYNFYKSRPCISYYYLESDIILRQDLDCLFTLLKPSTQQVGG